MKNEIKIGGVPEHFNLPWHSAIEKGLFLKQNLEIEWIDYPTGTGAMAKDLRTDALDVAILLTEGIVADIINGNSSKLVQWFVKSPLIWGIHSPANSSFNIAEIKNKRFAISRFGSGSHLMACVLASQMNFEINQNQFVIVGTIDGAVEALSNDKADVFMWEKFMTQPYIDKHIFNRIGECPTPWSCFAIAVRNEILEKKPEQIKLLLEIINGETKNFKADTNLPGLISKKFHLKHEDSIEWLEKVEWASGGRIEKAEIDIVINKLLTINLIEKTLPAESLLWI